MKICNKALKRSPEIERLIELMRIESEEFGSNQRKSYRETIVCPVAVAMDDGEGRFKAFSKNISATGICIIGENEVTPEKLAALEIFSGDMEKTTVRGRCVWSRSFHGFYMSGWKFLQARQQLMEKLT